MATETLSSLVGKLRLNASIEPSDLQFPDSDLEQLIIDAAKRHNSAYVTSESTINVPSTESLCVVYLAASRVFTIRAARFATAGDMSGASGYGQDSRSPFDKCLKMAEWFSGAGYRNECSLLGILKSTTEVVVSDTIVRDRITGIQLPLGKLPRENGRVGLSLASQTIIADGSLVLNFDLTGVRSINQVFIVWLKHPDENVLQPWNADTIPVPGVHPESVTEITLNAQQAKLTGFVGVVGDKFRFALAVSSMTIPTSFTFSEELLVTLT